MELGEALEVVPVEVPDSLGLVGGALATEVATFSTAGTLEDAALGMTDGATATAADDVVLSEGALPDSTGAGADPPRTPVAAPQVDGS